MLLDYYFILILSGLAVIIPVGAIVIGFLLGPRRPDVVPAAQTAVGDEC